MKRRIIIELPPMELTEEETQALADRAQERTQADIARLLQQRDRMAQWAQRFGRREEEER